MENRTRACSYPWGSALPAMRIFSASIRRILCVKGHHCSLSEAIIELHLHQAWRRLVRDYKQRIDVSRQMIYVAMGGLMLKRLFDKN